MIKTTKVFVFSDSVHDIGGRSLAYPESVRECGRHIGYFVNRNEYRELHDLSRHRVEPRRRSFSFPGKSHIREYVQRHIVEQGQEFHKSGHPVFRCHTPAWNECVQVQTSERDCSLQCRGRIY